MPMLLARRTRAEARTSITRLFCCRCHDEEPSMHGSFCCTVDDAADLAPSVAEAESQLNSLRHDLIVPSTPSGPLFAALADTFRFGVKSEHLMAVIDEFSKTSLSRYDNFEQLRENCWKVASAVGLLSLPVFAIATRRLWSSEDQPCHAVYTFCVTSKRIRAGRICPRMSAGLRYQGGGTSSGVVDEAFAIFAFQVRRAPLLSVRSASFRWYRTPLAFVP